ncbi:MAG: hypothetical protein ABIG34_05405 [Candidatus Peregrinibacteria bacterium]
MEFKFHIGEKKDGVRSDSEMKAVVSLLRKMGYPVVPSFYSVKKEVEEITIMDVVERRFGSWPGRTSALHHFRLAEVLSVVLSGGTLEKLHQ